VILLYFFTSTPEAEPQEWNLVESSRIGGSCDRLCLEQFTELRATFDQVASLSVEGLNKSAIARVDGIGCNTVDRLAYKISGLLSLGEFTKEARS
jgi:hypothetical protein